MKVLSSSQIDQREALHWDMGSTDESSKILQRAILISLAIHGVLLLGFLTARIPVMLQRIHQTRVINYQEVKNIFQEVPKNVPIMAEVKATSSGSAKPKAKSKIEPKKPVKKPHSGEGLLKLALSNAPVNLIELPAPTVPGAKLSKTIDVEDAMKYTEGPVRLLSLEHIQAKTYKGGMTESLRVSDKIQVSIEAKEVEVRGGLEDPVVRRIIEERLPSIRICYETALLQAPDLQGEVVVSWTVQPSGQVSDVMSESKEMKSEDIQKCLKERVGQWKFPEPKGGGIVNIRYPFVFRRVNG